MTSALHVKSLHIQFFYENWEYRYEPLVYNGIVKSSDYDYRLTVSVYALTFLSLKCKNDIQIISIGFTDPERQKHPGTAWTSSRKQTSDLNTGKNVHGSVFFCFAVLSPDVKQVWLLLFGISKAVIREPESVPQSNIRIVLDFILWCVDVLLCVRRADASAQASHWSVCGGTNKRKTETEGGSVLERCCSGGCVGLPGWQAVSAIFLSTGFGEKKDGSWEGTRKFEA